MEENGGCDQTCSKFGSGLQCSCHDGFKLGENKQSCIKGEGRNLLANENE